jgi:hypothetical protein
MRPGTVALLVTIVALGSACSAREAPPATGTRVPASSPAAASAPAATTPPPSWKGRHIPLLIKGPDDPEAFGCGGDADCVLHSARDGNCCGDLCWASSAYNVRFARRLAEHVERACAPLDIRCPKAKCAREPVGRAARCQAGRCVVAVAGGI